MVFQHDLTAELQQAISQPPPETICPEVLRPETGYFAKLVRLSRERRRNYWAPTKFSRRLRNGRWACKISIGVFRRTGTAVYTRRIACDEADEAMEMASALLYHDLLLEFKESRDSGRVATRAPVGPRVGVWRIEKRGATSTKNVTKADLRREEAGKDDVRKWEKEWKKQQKARDALLGKIGVQEQRLDRKLRKRNAGAKGLQEQVSTNAAATPEDAEVEKAREDLAKWRKELDDFDRRDEIEGARRAACLALDRGRRGRNGSPSGRMLNWDQVNSSIRSTPTNARSEVSRSEVFQSQAPQSQAFQREAFQSQAPQSQTSQSSLFAGYPVTSPGQCQQSAADLEAVQAAIVDVTSDRSRSWRAHGAPRRTLHNNDMREFNLAPTGDMAYEGRIPFTPQPDIADYHSTSGQSNGMLDQELVDFCSAFE